MKVPSAVYVAEMIAMVRGLNDNGLTRPGAAASMALLTGDATTSGPEVR